MIHHQIIDGLILTHNIRRHPDRLDRKIQINYAMQQMIRIINQEDQNNKQADIKITNN